MNIPTIMEDGREIDTLFYIDKGLAVGVTVNENNSLCSFKVDKIEAYGEPGQGAMVPWFAIWIDGEIVDRINAAAIEEICYKQK